MAIRILIFAGLVIGLLGLGSCGSMETSPPRPQPSEARKKELLAANEILTACTAHDIEKVKALLEKNPELINAENDLGVTPLIRAMFPAHPNQALVRLLLEKGAKVKGSARHPDAPLQFAAMRGDKAIVLLLLAHGADIHARDGNGTTVMDFAAFQNRKEVADVLLAHGAEMTMSDAAALGDTKKMKEILRRDPKSVNAYDSRGFTPLHWAASKGHIEAVQLLMKNGASPFQESRFGLTSCFLAREYKRTEIIQWMRCP